MRLYTGKMHALLFVAVGLLFLQAGHAQVQMPCGALPPSLQQSSINHVPCQEIPHKSELDALSSTEGDQAEALRRAQLAKAAKDKLFDAVTKIHQSCRKTWDPQCPRWNAEVKEAMTDLCRLEPCSVPKNNKKKGLLGWPWF